MYTLGIEVFLAIVRAQSISRAAEMLNLAQSTTSKRLKVLEQELGTSLIERGKGLKSIHLTPAGEAFIELAERWDLLLHETQVLQSSNPKLSLSVGTLDSINYAVFPWLYQQLNQHLPKISLRVITGHSSDFYDLIDCRKVDVAFTLEEMEHPNVMVKRCYSEPMVGLRIATPSRLKTEFVHPHELDPNYELYVPWSPSYQIWHNQWWNPLAPGRVRLDTAQLILSFLYNPQQWTIVPLSVAKKSLLHSNLDIFHLSEAPPERTCYKITHKYPKTSTVESLTIFDNYLHTLLQRKISTLP